MSAELKGKATRNRLNWAPTTIALIGIAASVGFSSTISGDPPPTSPNYADQRVLRLYVLTALFLVALVAPLVSVALGLVRRVLIGTLAGVLAGAFPLFWVASPSRACCGGDESAVIGFLRSINSSQQAYASSCAEGKFASTLETLTKPPLQGGTPFTFDGAGRIFDGAGRGYWRGYAVTMQIPDGSKVEILACNGRHLVVPSYFVEAHLVDAVPGRRNFATDERGTIYWNDDGTTIQPGMAGAKPLE